ncbi:MAG: hypothetical protein AB7P24_12475 [Nitrospira sp.]
MNQIYSQTIMMAVLALGVVGADNVCSASSPQRESSPSKKSMDLGGQRVVTEPTDQLIPGNQLVLGRIKNIRSDQIEVDIGNLQPLFVPLKPAQQKGQTFKPGDAIVVTISDHNAVVDYHHPGERSHHQVLRGRLTTPLTVGLDKAIIKTQQGDQPFVVAERARGKLSAMPVGPELLFLADETGQLVDAQLAGKEAVQESAENNKARIKGAHRQMRAIFKGVESPSDGGEGRLKIVQRGREQQVPFHPPLDKLDQLKSGQDVVLLMDDQGYVLEIATPNIAPNP